LLNPGRCNYFRIFELKTDMPETAPLRAPGKAFNIAADFATPGIAESLTTWFTEAGMTGLGPDIHPIDVAGSRTTSILTLDKDLFFAAIPEPIG
jgi:hypothetical protein